MVDKKDLQPIHNDRHPHTDTTHTHTRIDIDSYRIGMRIRQIGPVILIGKRKIHTLVLMECASDGDSRTR